MRRTTFRLTGSSFLQMKPRFIIISTKCFKIRVKYLPSEFLYHFSWKHNPANIYLHRVKNRNTRSTSLVLVSLLNIFHISVSSFYFRLSAGKCLLGRSLLTFFNFSLWQLETILFIIVLHGSGKQNYLLLLLEREENIVLSYYKVLEEFTLLWPLVTFVLWKCQ